LGGKGGSKYKRLVEHVSNKQEQQHPLDRR